MKKGILSVVIMCLIFALCACNDSGGERTSIDNTEEESINFKDDDTYEEDSNNSEQDTIDVVLANAELLYPSYNDSFQYNVYKKSNSEECFIELTDYLGSDTDVSIPSEIDGYEVWSIGDECFYPLNGIVSIELPQTIKKIGTRAFAANSHFPRPAGPHFPASQGHIKRSALEIGRARGAPPC